MTYRQAKKFAENKAHGDGWGGTPTPEEVALRVLLDRLAIAERLADKLADVECKAGVVTQELRDAFHLARDFKGIS